MAKWNKRDDDAREENEQEAGEEGAEQSETVDAHGNVLHNGDTVLVIKDLKVKGNGATLKKGTKVRSIRLTDNEDEIEGTVEGIRGLVLKTEFVKKG